MVFFIIFWIIIFVNIKAFIIIQLEAEVDDCVSKVYLEGKNPIWDDANCDEIDNFNNNFPKTIYYEIGKKLYI